MTPRQARHVLRDTARTTVGGRWSAYASPPPSLNVPALVVAPRSPYRVRGTICSEEVRVTLTILVNINSSEDGLDLLDDTATTIREAINTDPALVAYVEAVQDIGVIQEVGGVEYLAAILNITMEV